MLKLESSLNDSTAKVLSQKRWHFFIYQNDDYGGIKGLRSNQTDSLSAGRPRDRRNNARDIVITESFHCAIGPILSIAHAFGIFPIAGVRSPSPTQLQFKTCTCLVIYSTVIIAMVLIVTIISVIHMIKTINSEAFQARVDIGGATAGAVFYGNSLLSMILFFWLSLHWKSLQCEWRAMEQYIDSDSSETPRLRQKFFLITFGILLLAFIEHILSILNNVEGYDWNSPNSTFCNFLEVYCLRSHSFIFDTLQYNFSFGLFIFVLSKLATFVWNFTDLFIILVATGLAERYKCLNKKVANTVAKYRSRFDWHKLREDYAILSFIVKKVDQHISPIILLSFGNNLYFVCLQLLNGLSLNESSMFGTIYFFGSFAFLIGRACAVTLFTARIHDHSRRALPYLYDCSSSSYNMEVQRLQYQLATDDVVLTGLRFFSITKNFLLAVVGAITTYEVVLLQFSDNGKT